MPSVNQNGKLDGSWTAATDDSFNGGASCTAGEEHIVYQNDVSFIDIKRQFCMADEWILGKRSEIVTVIGDVKAAAGNRNTFYSKNIRGNDAGDGHTAPENTDQTEIFHSPVFLDDFMRDAHESAAERCLIHDLGFEFHMNLLPQNLIWYLRDQLPQKGKAIRK